MSGWKGCNASLFSLKMTLQLWGLSLSKCADKLLRIVVGVLGIAWEASNGTYTIFQGHV